MKSAPVPRDEALIDARLQLRHPGFALDVHLCLPGQGVSVLLGPSGCGKTTVLRALAGLGRAQGHVRVSGDVWQDDARGLWRPVHQRPIGMVFQDAGLFEHLTVQGNLDYGWRRVRPSERRLRHDDIVGLLGIGHLLSRRPQGLSGGERQRVAIARALLTSPALLLLDEPLSALDAERKGEVLPYLERLSETGVPMVYVTHSHDEAARLADHVVCLRDGRVQAAGPATELWTRLDTPLSQPDDAAAVLLAEVVRHEPEQGLSLLRLVGEEVALWTGLCPQAEGHRLKVRVLARDVSVSLSAARDSSIINILPAVLASMGEGPQGSVLLRLRLHGGACLLARVTRRSVEHLGLHAGQAVFAQVKGVALWR